MLINLVLNFVCAIGVRCVFNFVLSAGCWQDTTSLQFQVNGVSFVPPTVLVLLQI